MAVFFVAVFFVAVFFVAVFFGGRVLRGRVLRGRVLRGRVLRDHARYEVRPFSASDTAFGILPNAPAIGAPDFRQPKTLNQIATASLLAHSHVEVMRDSLPESTPEPVVQRPALLRKQWARFAVSWRMSG